MTCQVSIDDVIPAPTFSFSLAGLAFETPVPGTNTGTHYQGQFYPNPTVGGEYQVTCRVTNTVLPNTRQDSQTTAFFRRKCIVQFWSEVIVSDFMCWCWYHVECRSAWALKVITSSPLHELSKHKNIWRYQYYWLSGMCTRHYGPIVLATSSVPRSTTYWTRQTLKVMNIV